MIQEAAFLAVSRCLTAVNRALQWRDLWGGNKSRGFCRKLRPKAGTRTSLSASHHSQDPPRNSHERLVP